MEEKELRVRAIDRLYLYLKYRGVSPAKFEKEIGLTYGYLSKQKNGVNRIGGIGEGIINKIHKHCPELSLVWLYKGEGKMIISPEDKSFEYEDMECSSLLDIMNQKDKLLNDLYKQYGALEQEVKILRKRRCRCKCKNKG